MRLSESCNASHVRFAKMAESHDIEFLPLEGATSAV